MVTSSNWRQLYAAESYWRKNEATTDEAQNEAPTSDSL